jgi:hypothetical protein
MQVKEEEDELGICTAVSIVVSLTCTAYQYAAMMFQFPISPLSLPPKNIIHWLPNFLKKLIYTGTN